MSVDLEKLPYDEELTRVAANEYGLGGYVRVRETRSAIQNVLDGLNWFRCKHKFEEQERKRAEASRDEAWKAVRVRDEDVNVTVKELLGELARVNAELLEVRNSAHHNRIFGVQYVG